MKIAIARVLTLAVALAATSVAHAIDQPPITGKVFVFLQDAAPGCENCGLLVGALVGAEDKVRAQAMARVNDGLLAAMPDLAIPKMVHESFCKKLFGVDGLCDPVIIVDKGGSDGAQPSIKPAPGDMVVKFSIEFQRNSFRVIASVSDVSAKGQVESLKLGAWYLTPPRTQLSASPFDLVSKRNEAKVQAARDYWLAGEPSFLQKELMRAIQEVPAIIRASTIALRTETDDFWTWWKELPKVKTFMDARALKCKGYQCGLRYVDVSSDRIWHAESAGAIVVVSYPIVEITK